jgi:predicted outer membrane repeat protein
MSVVRCAFTGNQAEMDGGAIKFDGAEISVDF